MPDQTPEFPSPIVTGISAISAIGASTIVHFVSDSTLQLVITQMTAVGGLMIVAIGLNLLQIVKVRVADLLPALFIVVLLAKYIPY